MEVTANIALKPKKTRSIQRFHPWIFSGAIKSIDGNLQLQFEVYTKPGLWKKSPSFITAKLKQI